MELGSDRAHNVVRLRLRLLNKKSEDGVGSEVVSVLKHTWTTKRW